MTEAVRTFSPPRCTVPVAGLMTTLGLSTISFQRSALLEVMTSL